MKQLIFCGIILFAASGFGQHFSQYVNPMIGTGGHGHTYPGATTPFGMVQLSPDTRVDGSWDGCSGYHYSDNRIYGFSHTHLSGTGCSDYGDIMLMPTMGKADLNREGYSATFSHQNETASAGFYSVRLDNGIGVRLTASTRVGLHEYTFPQSGQANVVMDLNHRDKLLMGEVHIIDDHTIEVFRRSEAWARDQWIFARITFSKPVRISAVNNNAFAPAKVTDKQFAGSLLALAFSTEVSKGEKLLVKVALSLTGYDGAKNNDAEIRDWNFEKVRKRAVASWDSELSKININSKENEKLAVFYTALYHTMTQPNIAQDVDGKYRGRDNQIHRAKGFDYYSVFSLWDTFRAAHPLYTLIDTRRTADFINTFLAQYEQGGRLPVWELASNETDCMIGYHSVSVMADAMAKGIKGFDYEKAFEAAKHSAMLDHLGLAAYKKNGFISMGDEHESVSKTLEYAYDDWCIAQMARLLKKDGDYELFMKRSQSWKNLFDPQAGFMRPKKNGGWEKPFDPREVNNNFTEGNSWQYSFFVLQDIPGMVAAYGGKEKFERKLDELFSAPTQTTGREQADITGLIGQYAQGNEPSHHMVYLYNYIGKPEKTAEKVRFILDNFYKDAPDGLIGNEDCGQMSAWYVLSSLGLYAVTPGLPRWQTTMPYYVGAKVKTGSGTQTISANPPDNAFFGLKSHDAEDASPEDKIIPVPVIDVRGKSFKDSMSVAFQPAQGEIFYRSDSGTFQKYTSPFKIDKSSTVDFFAVDAGKRSDTVSSAFVKKPNDYSIKLISAYNPQYHAGGPDGLLDGIYGNENWRKGDWQGYQGKDFEAIVDLGKPTQISNLGARFLQDTGAWIVMPRAVTFYASQDGKQFTLLKTLENDVDVQDMNVRIKNFTMQLPVSTVRYVKVVATNFGQLPQWHPGAGGDAFIFIDEIEIR